MDEDDSAIAQQILKDSELGNSANEKPAKSCYLKMGKGEGHGGGKVCTSLLTFNPLFFIFQKLLLLQ